MKIAVRLGNPLDRAFVHDLADRTVMQSVAALRNPGEGAVHRALDRLLEIVEGQSHVAMIAELDGERAGFLLLLDELPDEVTSSPQGFIAYMAVEPKLRRHGVGRALLNAAEDEARKRSLPYMALMVTEDNAEARALYERGGYVTERRLLCKPL
ncbi:MAG: GNAT family N-acetyltransferase [Candidatus Eremiobacteraeota bacterium]|nr:GNAT family N-acetyltransferase [Candidatus Eremiobacteraeota bacterium]